MTFQPTHCLSCGDTSLRRIGPIPAGYRFAATRLSEPLPPTDLWRCEQCQLRFRWPTPSAELLAELYRVGENELWDYDATRREDFALAASWLAANAKGRSVLDIGCWDGAFLQMLAGEWRRYGVEINEKAAERAANGGIEIIANDLGALADCQQRFDVVTAFDVIEHVADPRDLVQRMASLATPNGLLMIGTGNADAWTWRLMGASYYYCVNPEHLSFITPEWCRIAATALDREVVGVLHYSHAQQRGALRIVKQAAANITYRFAPKLVAFMRSKGVGKLDVSSHQAWQKIPPTWMTAKDHVLLVIGKKS